MSKKMEVSAKAPKVEGSPAAVIMVDYGETAEESIQMFGSDAVNSNAFANWRVTLQAGIRRGLEAGKTQDQIQAELGTAKMGVATTGGKVDPIQASLAQFKTMNQKEREAYLAQLKAVAMGAEK